MYRAIVCLILAVTACRAAVADTADLTMQQRLESLESEVAELRAQSSVSGQSHDICYAESGPTWNTGAELTLLRPHAAGVVVSNLFPQALRLTPEYDLDAAFRVWLGRENDAGLGWRVAYWGFQDKASVTLPGDGIELSDALSFHTVDLEMTRRGSFGDWDILASMGARIGGLKRVASARDQAGPAGVIQHDFDGGGLTFALDTKQPLGSTDWSLYGRFRGSLLYGVTDFVAASSGTNFIDGVVRGTITDQTVAVWEMQLGLQFDRATSFGNLFGRAGIETQLWELPPVALGIGDQNIGLLGPTFLIGLER